MSRGVGRGKIFLANDDYSRFLEYVAKAREKFDLDIFAFQSKTWKDIRRKIERITSSAFKVCPPPVAYNQVQRAIEPHFALGDMITDWNEIAKSLAERPRGRNSQLSKHFLY
ncbi:MAG: hypothetical protein SCARUB_03335 [Candidatus Scalindua rubra]|uniref:Uncharacterized protein n=1 Tax=Candidatus Scalindua rubra TaxID=1872076 RepID=A0A1E3X7G2_9BACT|nr:MAG: hypothetical protein SCARUB_03335 [Candidatus Scalindua rubra]